MILTLHNNPFQPNLVQTLSFLQLETNRNDETTELQRATYFFIPVYISVFLLKNQVA